MANTTITGVLPADVQKVLDALGGWFKSQYAALGLGAPSESTTLAAKAITGRTTILGDGSATYGIQNAMLAKLLTDALNSICVQSRYDTFFNINVRTPLNALDSLIMQTLPNRTTTDTWKFQSSTGQRALDLYLTRLNCNNTGCPVMGAVTPTLTATTGGQIAPTTAGAEARVKVTYVGSQDYFESQPSSAATQVALSGKNNAWTLGGLPGTVPASTTKLRVYRQLDNNAGASDPYGWDQDVAVTAGAAFPAITLKNSDIQIRMDWPPPSWLQLQMMPEEAALYALAYGAPASNIGQQNLLFTFSVPAFADPKNVAVNPQNAFLGINNPSSNGEFARRVVGTGFTAGAVPLTNDNAQVLQGFAGAANGIQARVITALNANASLTNIGYTFLSSAFPTTPQTGNIAATLTLNSALGSTVSLAIPAGQLVLTVTGDTCGTAASGTYIYESIALRSI